MRAQYQTWRKETLALLDAVDLRVASAVVAVESLLEASNGLTIGYHATGNGELLASVHAILRSSLRHLYFLQSNAIVHVGKKLMSSKLNSSGMVNFEELKNKIAAKLHTVEPPLFSPLETTFQPGTVCSTVSSQRFDDQMGVTVVATLQNTSANILLVYDCLAQAGSWSIKLARRALVCQIGVEELLDPVVRRESEQQVNDYIDSLPGSVIESPFPLPTRVGVSFVTTGELISDSFISLCRVDCSIEGFRAKPLQKMSPDLYQLPPDKDLAILLSAGACEAFVASILDAYQRDVSNKYFFDESHFPKWLDKNVTLCLDDACAARDALQFNVDFHGRYEDTTAGKDWNVDIYGYVPVRCTFSHFYNANGLNIQLHVAQSGGLTITSHKLNAGLIGDLLSVTNIVDNKINDLKGRVTKQINEDVPFLTFKDASGSDPFVKGGALVIELAVHGSTANRESPST